MYCFVFVQCMTHQPFWSQVSSMVLYSSHNRKLGPRDTCGTDRRPPKTEGGRIDLLPLLKTLAMISLLLPVVVLAVSLSLLIILLVIINLYSPFPVVTPAF